MPSSSFVALDDLTYDFDKYQPGVRGIIPEPSSEQIEVFVNVLSEVFPVKTDEDGKAALDLASFSARFDNEDAENVELIVSDAVARLCSDSPNAEQIRALPHRPKQAFYGWIVGTFLSPEA